MVGGMDRVDERSSVVDRGNDSMVSHGGNGVNSMDSMVSHGSHRMDSVVGDRVSSLVDRLRVGLALIPHVGNEAVLVVGVVGDDLDTAVRKLHSVLALDDSVLILSLSLGEVSRSKLSLTMIFAFPLVKIVQSDSLTFHTRQHLRIRRQMAVVAYKR